MKLSIKLLISLSLSILLLSGLLAQETPPAEANLVNIDKLQNWSYNKSLKGTIVKSDSLEAFIVSTNVHLDKRYALSAKVPLKPQRIKKGEKLLLAFEAKTTEASLETNEAKVLFQINTSESTKDRIIQVVSIPAHWQTFYIPIEIDAYIKKKDLDLVMQFGFPPQQFYIKNISLYKYGKEVALGDLPKTSIQYIGMEADAAWRTEAFERIDSIRKGPFSIQVQKDGEALHNVGMEIKLVKHHFDWGVALSASEVLDRDFYQKKVAESFGLVVLKNDLKIKHYDRRTPKQDIFALAQQLRKRGIKLKGHVLIWPGFRYLTPAFKKHKDDPAKIKSLMSGHLNKILSETDGYIDRWDVVNEAYTNRDLQEITGSEDILYNGFTKLKNEYPNVKRFVNEYGIINRGGLNTIKQKWYYDYIQRIDENTNGAVDGIGIQSHIGTDLTPPSRVLELLDYYGELGKNISISEFTMDVKDPLIRQMYTEDFLTAIFSHPNVSEFLFWGMKGTLDDKVDVYHSDWSLGSMGKAYFNMVHGLWSTHVSTVTNDNGMIEDSGFYGTYEYTYLINGEPRKGKFKHLPGQKTRVNINL